HATLPVACRAGSLDLLTLAVAIGAGAHVDDLAEERILDAAHLTLAATRAAGLLARAARAVTSFAFAVTLELDLFGDAGGDFLERERPLDLQVGSARRSRASTAASAAAEASPAAEDVAELGEDVLEVAEPL